MGKQCKASFVVKSVSWQAVAGVYKYIYIYILNNIHIGPGQRAAGFLLGYTLADRHAGPSERTSRARARRSIRVVAVERGAGLVVFSSSSGLVGRRRSSNLNG